MLGDIMAAINNITGHSLVSKVGDKDQQEKFSNNFDAIFGVKPKKEKYVPPALDDWDEKRMDVIGQNGNVGYETQD
jgi:hypothetical protein